jgi:hypothetical protein
MHFDDSAYRPPIIDPDAMAKRLIQRDHNRDGLPEIAVGLTFLVIGGLSYAQASLPRESDYFKAAVLGLALLVPALCFGSPAALKWVRRHYLMDRFGYMESRPLGRKQIGIGIAFAILLAMVLFGVVDRLAEPDRWLLAGTGLLGGAIAAWSGQLPRFVIGGVLVAVTGIGVAFSGVSLVTGFAILFGLQGLLALVSGSVVLWRFLHQPVE